MIIHAVFLKVNLKRTILTLDKIYFTKSTDKEFTQ
jgi:hypothetical protein